MPGGIIPSENTTNILTGLTPDATSAKIQPEGIDSRGTSCRNNREPVVIILCPGVVASARSYGQRKSQDPFYAPAGRAIYSFISSATEKPRLLPGKR
ncbi:hypothetical protein AVEN_132339-1 [Araneus ventricosus]|uniref:Uncharacterized protein n=1 Tax=Araneus ventricosus TaxID=182803 RepID=A0A4Y2MU70_ARAVE|nr:hypothetical protein AVEN_132339-1 [Araneus ventricosus]